MMNVKHLGKWILVAVYVVTMIALLGCTVNQETIHSNCDYDQQRVALQQDFIPEMGTPLAAPKLAPERDGETITFVCDFQAE